MLAWQPSLLCDTFVLLVSSSLEILSLAYIKGDDKLSADDNFLLVRSRTEMREFFVAKWFSFASICFRSYSFSVLTSFNVFLIAEQCVQSSIYI